MGEFNKESRISARVHASVKEKLQKSGYNSGQAITYFAQLVSTELDSLKIDEFFLNKEIEDLKDELIIKEMRLEEIQKRKDKIYVGNLSELRVKSYQKIISSYTDANVNASFDEFIEGNYLQGVISKEAMLNNCDVDEFMEGLLKYYQDVIQVGMTC